MQQKLFFTTFSCTIKNSVLYWQKFLKKGEPFMKQFIYMPVIISSESIRH